MTQIDETESMNQPMRHAINANKRVSAQPVQATKNEDFSEDPEPLYNAMNRENISRTLNPRSDDSGIEEMRNALNLNKPKSQQSHRRTTSQQPANHEAIVIF